MKLEDFEVGTELTKAEITFTEDYVNCYTLAVGDKSLLYVGSSAKVPPLAAVAWLLKDLLQRLELPPGTVHSSQEIECSDTLPVGNKAVCCVCVDQNTARGQWRFLTLRFTIGENENSSIQGKIGLLIPRE